MNLQIEPQNLGQVRDPGCACRLEVEAHHRVWSKSSHPSVEHLLEILTMFRIHENRLDAARFEPFDHGELESRIHVMEASALYSREQQQPREWRLRQCVGLRLQRDGGRHRACTYNGEQQVRYRSCRDSHGFPFREPCWVECR